MSTENDRIDVRCQGNADALRFLGCTVEDVQNCHTDTCACNSHDREYIRATLPAGTVEERLAGDGCVSDTCAHNTHPMGYVGRALYRLPGGTWLAEFPADYRSEDIGHAPDLRACDPDDVRARHAEERASYDAAVYAIAMEDATARNRGILDAKRDAAADPLAGARARMDDNLRKTFG